MSEKEEEMSEEEEPWLSYHELESKQDFVDYLAQLREEARKGELENDDVRAYVTRIGPAMDSCQPGHDKKMDLIQMVFGVFDELDWRHLGRIFAKSGSME